MLAALSLAILGKQAQHVLNAGRGRVAHAVPVHLLCHVVLLFLASVVLVGIPFGDIPRKELHDVVDLHGLHLRRGHESCFAQASRFLNELLGTEVEARRALLPEDVVKVHHASRGGPLEHRHVIAGAEDGHDQRFQRELQADSTIPRNEERVLVDELAPLAFAQGLVVPTDFLHFCDDPDDLVPVIPLRSERAEETRHVAQVVRPPVRLNLDLPHHRQDDLAQPRFARSGPRYVLCVPYHLLRQHGHAHLLNVLGGVARRLRVILDEPFLRAESLDALAHVRPPIQEGHVRLSRPASRTQHVRAPRDQVWLCQFEIVWVSRLVLENGRERARDPTSYLVCVPDRTCLVVNFWRVQQRFVVFSSLACGRRLRLRECLLIIACGCRLLLLLCGRCLSLLMACGRCLSLLLMACGRSWHLHGIVRGSCLLVPALPLVRVPVICLIVILRSTPFIPELLKHLGTLLLGWHPFGLIPQRGLERPRLQLDFCRVGLLLSLLKARKYVELLRQIKRRSQGIELAVDPLLYPADPHLLLVLVRLKGLLAGCQLLLGPFLDRGHEIIGQLIVLYEPQDKVGEVLRTHAGRVCFRQVLLVHAAVAEVEGGFAIDRPTHFLTLHV